MVYIRYSIHGKIGVWYTVGPWVHGIQDRSRQNSMLSLLVNLVRRVCVERHWWFSLCATLAIHACMVDTIVCMFYSNSGVCCRSRDYIRLVGVVFSLSVYVCSGSRLFSQVWQRCPRSLANNVTGTQGLNKWPSPTRWLYMDTHV